MKIGVTGSRQLQLSPRLIDKFTNFLMGHPEITELHHGDCVGADETFQIYANVAGIKTIAHPPTDGKFRAYTKSDVILDPKPYLDRNKDIVAACDFLIAAADGPEKVRSGTWSTVRHAKKVGRRGVVWMFNNEAPRTN